MTAFLLAAGACVLSATLLGLVRVVRGPAPTDRLAAVQLFGSGTTATLILVGAALEARAALDMAILLALLSPFTIAGVFRGAMRGAA